jgi:TPP-dependent pyruvate/acetoin dehydrogenase alpha subunit
MKRDPSLVPLSHDHHHALVQARRLREGAEPGAPSRRAAVASFLHFFSEETIRHFCEEEERLFPALVSAVVGGGLPAAVGAAFAFKLRHEPRVSLVFFGDGATNMAPSTSR